MTFISLTHALAAVNARALERVGGIRGLISKLNIIIYYNKLRIITLTTVQAILPYKLWAMLITERVYYRNS